MPISTKLSAGRVRSTYEFIKANGDKYSVHARQSLARSSRLSNPALVGRQAIPPDPQPPAAAVHGDAAKQCLGNRYRLHSDVARLALPGRRHGPVLAQSKIVGWSARPTIHRDLVLDAVLITARPRRPRGTVVHSDQGPQHGCHAGRRLCHSNHLEPSMSRKGTAGTTPSRRPFLQPARRRNGSRSKSTRTEQCR